MARGGIEKLGIGDLRTTEPGLQSDGGNLYLRTSIGPDDKISRGWIFRFRLPGKRPRDMGLGSLDSIGLARARELAQQYRELVATGWGTYYQVELESIVGGRTEDSARYKCVATLTPEPDNPYDPHAVCVAVDGFKVGHLSRDWAAKFNAALASSGYAQATCNALIVGGWGRGRDDRGHFGIKLDIALPLELKPRAPAPN